METLANICHRFAVPNDHVILNLEGAHAVRRIAADVPCRREVGRVGNACGYPPYARVHPRVAKCGNGVFIIPSHKIARHASACSFCNRRKAESSLYDDETTKALPL